MRIMYVTNQMYLHGGIEKMLSQKINHWISDYNYEVILCTSEHRDRDFVYNLDSKVKHLDLKINYYRNKSYFHPKNLFKSLQHFFALQKVVAQTMPDVIISVNYTPEQFFLPFVAKKIPKIKEFHSSGVTLITPKTFFDKLKHRLFLLFGKYDVQVVLNEDEKKYYPFQNLIVIPNFIEKPPIKEFIKKQNTILAAGRMTQVKQFDHLIHIWSMIATDFPDWQVKIYGDGDPNFVHTLEKLINELNVSNIYLLGATNRLSEEMHKASIYAMTSETECFPMVLLEAQSAGLAIVSYDCPNGPRSIINPTIDGILSPQNDKVAFANNLMLIMKDEVLRNKMSILARNNEMRFSSQTVMEKWNELLLTLKLN